MPFNGSGTYVPPSPNYPVVAGTTITAANFNAIIADLASGLSNTLTRDGQSIAAAVLNLGSNRITGLAPGILGTDAATFTQMNNAAAAAGSAGTVTNILPTVPTVLPYQVVTISGGVGTGTGGVDGTYAGGVSGGPTGFQWTYTISGGKLALPFTIINPGIAAANTAPVLSLPLGGLASPTVPTATTDVTPVGKSFYAVTADSQYLALWTNVAAVLTAVNGPDGNQLKVAIGNIALTANKIASKFAAGKAGKGSLLQRSAIQKGFALSGSGVPMASANYFLTGSMPCSEVQGIASAVGEFGSIPTMCFYDKDGNAVCRNLALFTATFTAGSPNFTITAWRQGNPGILPPGAPAPLTTSGTSDPLMSGMPLYDQTNNNNTVIPLGAYADIVSAIPYSTSAVYTMKGPGDTALNALLSVSINVWTGGCLPGVPITPQAGYGITQAIIQKTYEGTYGFRQYLDDQDFSSTNFAVVAEQRAYSGSVTTLYQRSSHDVGIGWGDVETSRPMLGRFVGAIGNSMLSHEAWSKTLTLLTRSKIVYRGAIAARQAHQFLDGASVGTILTNWNEQNPGNPNGVMVAADITGVEVLFIGTCGTNEQGYASGAVLGNAADGSNRMPYSIGAITESGAAVVVSLTTTNASATVTINTVLSQSALTPTLVGLVFPSTALFGLAGKTITTGPGTGAAGPYTINSGAGVTAGTASMMIGSYYGTMNWLLGKLLAFNSTNVGKLLPVIINPPPRYDLTSANGGVSAGTFDLVNIGNPNCASTSTRLSAFADANIALGQLWKIPVVDIFYKGGFSPFWEPSYYNTDNLHLNDGTLSGAQGNPIGDRALAQQMATLINGMVPIA